MITMVAPALSEALMKEDEKELLAAYRILELEDKRLSLKNIKDFAASRGNDGKRKYSFAEHAKKSGFDLLKAEKLITEELGYEYIRVAAQYAVALKKCGLEAVNSELDRNALQDVEVTEEEISKLLSDPSLREYFLNIATQYLKPESYERIVAAARNIRGETTDGIVINLDTVPNIFGYIICLRSGVYFDADTLDGVREREEGAYVPLNAHPAAMEIERLMDKRFEDRYNGCPDPLDETDADFVDGLFAEYPGYGVSFKVDRTELRNSHHQWIRILIDVSKADFNGLPPVCRGVLVW